MVTYRAVKAKKQFPTIANINCCLCHFTFVHYWWVCSAQCNQICIETIGSGGRLVGALAAPGKSLDKGAARGKSPLPGSLPTSIYLSPQVFLDASLLACLGRGRLHAQNTTRILHFFRAVVGAERNTFSNLRQIFFEIWDKYIFTFLAVHNSSIGDLVTD